MARELALREPRATVCVLEREQEIGQHQTSHNSGVIHAGIYYAPGSLKARLCVEGARELYEYCEQRDIASERCGKLIVATDAAELGRLDELERRARANGVPGLRRVDAAGIRELEPHARGIAALHSPDTGIVDFAAVARSYARGRPRSRRGRRDRLRGAARRALAARALRLVHARGHDRGHARGLLRRRLGGPAGGRGRREPDPRIVPFRGAYLRLTPERRGLVRALIYPVPDPSLPFLGVHLTRQVDGAVLIGPTALIAGARDAYRIAACAAGTSCDTLAWPGTWRMLRRWWRTGVTELSHAALRAALVRAAARYVPELRTEDVEPAFAGVRAQALARDGRLVDDFVFSHTERALHVRNAPSPAATSSLAIARHVVDEAARAFDLAH